MKELTANDVAEIIYTTIEEQPNINRKTLVPAISAVIRSFSKVNNVVVVEKNEQGRKHAANRAIAKQIYWQRKCKELDPENIEKYYAEVAELEKDFENENKR